MNSLMLTSTVLTRHGPQCVTLVRGSRKVSWMEHAIHWPRNSPESLEVLPLGRHGPEKEERARYVGGLFPPPNLRASTRGFKCPHTLDNKPCKLCVRYSEP